MEQEFRVLMHNGKYVSLPKLTTGIFYTEVPQLYSNEKTLEQIANDLEDCYNHFPTMFPIARENHLNNLWKCQLVAFTLKEKQPITDIKKFIEQLDCELDYLRAFEDPKVIYMNKITLGAFQSYLEELRMAQTTIETHYYQGVKVKEDSRMKDKTFRISLIDESNTVKTKA